VPTSWHESSTCAATNDRGCRGYQAERALQTTIGKVWSWRHTDGRTEGDPRTMNDRPRTWPWLWRFPIVLVVQWYLKSKNMALDTPERYGEHQREFFRYRILDDHSDKFAAVRTQIARYAVEAGVVQRALDLCTGHGFQAKAAREAGIAEVVGVDLVPERIERAERTCGSAGISFRAMDASALPFPDKHFDVITISAGLHDMPRPVREKALKEAARVARKRVIIFEPRVFQNRLLRWLGGTIGSIVDESLNFRDYANNGLAPLLKMAGLRAIREQHVWYRLMTITVCELRPTRRPAFDRLPVYRP
jgi:SAM-dependent methyltransferase